jgi:hypothetical protein
MDYQLVLQVQGESLADFDAMMNLEQDLTLQLSDVAEIDGHDMGCDEINIFILTSNPVSVFTHAKPVLERHGFLAHIKSGFRLLTEDTYTSIWPQNSKDKFSVA